MSTCSLLLRALARETNGKHYVRAFFIFEKYDSVGAKLTSTKSQSLKEEG
jgi:hypothetical protein